MYLFATILVSFLACLATGNPVPIPIKDASALITAAATTPPPSAANRWTAAEVTRKRSNGGLTCVWHMTLSQAPTPFTSSPSSSNNNNNTTNNNNGIVSCDFFVRVPLSTTENHQETKDCGVLSFPRTACQPRNQDEEEDDNNGSYDSGQGLYVSGGHNDEGFVVLVVENLGPTGEGVDGDNDPLAFFGFPDDALNSGADIPPQTSPVLTSLAPAPDPAHFV